MYNIDVSINAERDIMEAINYIDEELQDRTAAENLLDEVEKAIYSLTDMPKRYPLANDDILAGWGIRVFPINNYLVFYIVREQTKTVVIERFLYKRRDWSSILKIGK